MNKVIKNLWGIRLWKLRGIEKKEILLKILICIICVATIGFLGAILALLVAFSGGILFYSPFILIFTCLLIIFIIIKVFGLLKPKLFKILIYSFLGISVLTIGGYEINKAYNNSFSKVNEQGVDLNLYKPFTENNKLAILEEESTLQINDELPRIDGATAFYPLYAAFAQAVYPARNYNLYAGKSDTPEIREEVVCSTTPYAYNRLINGEVDIIFVFEPSEQQIQEAKSKGVELKLTPIGKEAFVFFVNSRNKVDNLSTEQIQDIYAGKITNWKELGGKNNKIRAFQRPENSGSQTMLQKLMEGKELMAPLQEDVVAGMGGIIDQTASYRNYKNAIGYSFLFFATEMIENNEIKLLKVDGVKPDKNTISSGDYPLAPEFYAVTAGSNNPNVDKFIEWMLSPQGQYLVDKTGYTPVR